MNKESSINNNKYYCDSDGMLVLDDKRTFIIGAYHLPAVDDPFRQLAENGYNYVHVEATKQMLDSAFQNQLKAWIVTGCITGGEKKQDRKRIAELVGKFKSHPALLCWEIVDEPAYTWNSSELRIAPDLVAETYQIIKQHDSEHFVYTNHGPVNLVSTLQNHKHGLGIINYRSHFICVLPYLTDVGIQQITLPSVRE